jgi:hypothetical protein
VEKKDNLIGALARAQATYTIAPKNGYNPHFKNAFSTFEDLILASRESLSREGISICQYVETDTDGRDYFVSRLMHESNESITSRVLMVVKDRSDVQKFGSVITYLKRYMYASLCGIATSEHDEDGNDVTPEPVITDKQVALLQVLVKSDADLESKICKHYNIGSLRNLPMKYMNQLVENLKARE